MTTLTLGSNMGAVLLLSIVLVLLVPRSTHALAPTLDITLLEVQDDRCRADIDTLKQALDKGQDWAERMVDAGVKTPVGILSQVEVQFGDFDQCLSVAVPVTAQYCLADVSLNNTQRSSFKWAVCLPASCSPQQVKTSLQTYMDRQGAKTKVEVSPSACTTRDSASSQLSSGGLIFWVVMAGIILAVCIATLVDDPQQSAGKSPSSSLMGVAQCLSARRCLQSLTGHCDNMPGINTQFVCGMHTLNMYILVLSHRYVSPMFFMNTMNYDYIEQAFSTPLTGIWFCHVDLMIDVAFFISAFLLALNYQLELQKRFVSPLQMITRRIFRLVPMYAMVIFWYTTVFRQLGDGPLWSRFMDDEERMCRRYWWANLLFIHNYVGNNQMCLQHTWFLSCDFQLYCAGLLLVLLAQKNLRLGMTTMALVFVASTLAAFLGTYINDLPAMTLFFKNYWLDVRADVMFQSMYTQGHYRGTSYIMGLLAGCYVYRNRGITLSKTMTNVLQTVGLVVCLIVYWSGVLVHKPRGSYSPMFAALYAASYHSIFGLGVALLFVSCALGTSTPVSRMLSWGGFASISKLCYGLYLTHYPLQYLWHGTSRSAFHGTLTTAVNLTISDLVVGQVISCFLHITIESPARNLYRYYTRGPSIPKQTEEKNGSTNGSLKKSL